METKLVWGIFLVIVSLVLGIAFKFFLLAKLLGTTSFDWLYLRAYFEDPLLAWASVIYILSWPMLFIGAYLCGTEGLKYAERYTKYLTHKYYLNEAKKHGRRLAKSGRRRKTPSARRPLQRR